jgi:lipid-A-disaccharide synthase
MIADSSGWGAMGIVESLRVAPRVRGSYYAALRALAAGPPGLCVPVDFGYMNVRLARRARALGWKVLYFMPPGSWRRDKQGEDLPSVADAIVTPFPWSAELLRRMGANAFWFGHPLKQMAASSPPPPARRESVAVLPGSRAHEIERNLEAIVPAVRDLGVPLEAALAPTISAGEFLGRWRRAGGDPDAVRATERDTLGVLKGARAAVVCSGTATLEAALCGCPSVVVYRGSMLMELEYWIRRPKIEHIALPNILLGRRALPELIQRDASPQGIRAELEPLLAGGPARDAQEAAFAELDGTLGPADALDRTVALMLEMAQGR